MDVTDPQTGTGPWQWFVIRRADPSLRVTSNPCVPVKKIWG